MGVAGDTYARIAAREGVDEAALRSANQNKPITAGLTFKLPPKSIVAKESAMVVALRKPVALSAEHDLVEVPPVEATPPPQRLLVHPGVVHELAAAKTAKDTATLKTTKDTPKTTKDTATLKTAKDTPKTAKDTPKTAKDTVPAKTAKDTAKTAKDTPKATASASKQSYTVKSGDNLYRIAKRYKIDQAALLRANNISDPAKLNSGMTLVIPH
ncbi:MAG: LysM peptidoglycan-binding domain-containing protein [Verrucomicrobia bacterium]|nr:MAG: LysM peptidoglycan-binding domain-containing protein [Verrucomicrobiota bacterium]